MIQYFKLHPQPTILKKIIDGKYKEKIPSVLFKYTYGGTDECNTLESAIRNPAERVMSVLNYGLHNCAAERKISDEKTEEKFRRINSMAELRKHPELRDK